MGDRANVMTIFSAQRGNVQSMAMPQAVRETGVELDLAPLLQLSGIAPSNTAYVVYPHRATENEIGSIGSHEIVFSVGESPPEGSLVRGLLNNLELPRKVYDAVQRARRTDMRLAKHLILDYITAVGVLQTEIMDNGLGLKQNISRRDHGSAVFGGVYGIYNPGNKPIPAHTTVVIDIPDLDAPYKDISQNERFGYHAIRPFLREYDETNPYDYKHHFGVNLNNFNPNDGPVMKVDVAIGNV